MFFDEVKDEPKMVVRDVFLLMTRIFVTKKTCQKKIRDLINGTTFTADAKKYLEERDAEMEIPNDNKK